MIPLANLLLLCLVKEKCNLRAEEKSQWLRAYVVPTEDPGLVPSTLMVAHNYP